jgi:hypothetical protein
LGGLITGIFQIKSGDLEKNFKRQLPNQVHAVLGVGYEDTIINLREEC